MLVIQGMQDAYNPLYILTEVQDSSVLHIVIRVESFIFQADEFIWKYQRGNIHRRQCRLNITFVRVLARMLLLFLFPSIFSIYPFMNFVVMDAFDRSDYAILSLVERTIPRTKDRSRVLKTIVNILFLLISSWILITELLHKTCSLPDEVSFYLFLNHVTRLLILLVSYFYSETFNLFIILLMGLRIFLQVITSLSF